VSSITTVPVDFSVISLANIRWKTGDASVKRYFGTMKDTFFFVMLRMFRVTVSMPSQLPKYGSRLKNEHWGIFLNISKLKLTKSKPICFTSNLLIKLSDYKAELLVGRRYAVNGHCEFG
jgi:hypothetical protein